MKLLIEIPEKMYHMINARQYDYGDMNIIIQNGIPLDKIKKQIDEQSVMHMDGEIYIRNFDVKWILEGNEVIE